MLKLSTCSFPHQDKMQLWKGDEIQAPHAHSFPHWAGQCPSPAPTRTAWSPRMVMRPKPSTYRFLNHDPRKEVRHSPFPTTAQGGPGRRSQEPGACAGPSPA